MVSGFQLYFTNAKRALRKEDFKAAVFAWLDCCSAANAVGNYQHIMFSRKYNFLELLVDASLTAGKVNDSHVELILIAFSECQGLNAPSLTVLEPREYLSRLFRQIGYDAAYSLCQRKKQVVEDCLNGSSLDEFLVEFTSNGPPIYARSRIGGLALTR